MRFLFQKLLALLWWLLNFRALRLGAIALFLLWNFDSAVTFFTDASWFSALGFGEIFWRSRLNQIAFSLGFFVLTLGAAIPFLRAASRPADGAHGARSFPRALDFLGHWHGLAPRLSWLVVLVFAFLGARHFGNLADDFAFFQSLNRTDSAPLLWNFSAAFWLGWWPIFTEILTIFWRFFVALLAVLALGGGVRALPFLASKTPVSPARWLRALLILGIFVLFLRAVGYLAQIPDFARGSEFSGFEAFVLAPLAVFGAVLCALAGFLVLRRAPRKTVLFGVLSALFLPAVLGFVLRPFLFWLPSPLDAKDLEKTAFVSPVKRETGADSLARSWPLWDENLVLGAARNLVSSRGDSTRQIELRKGALWRDENGVWHGGAAGIGVPLDGSTRRASQLSRDEWLSLDLARTQNGAPRADERFLPIGDAFFGFDGTPLWSENPQIGAPFRGFSALLWSWRLRSPMSLLESASHPRIVAFRGASEVASRLAPHFSWTTARPIWHEGAWWMASDGYRVSADFPGVNPDQTGFFAGQNFARRSLQMLQNPTNGAVKFFPMNDEAAQFHARNAGFLPEKSANATQDFARNEIEKRGAQSGEIWTNGAVLTDLEKLEISGGEVEKRLAALDARAQSDFRGEAGETLQNGASVAWRDGNFWWIGRAYFAVKRAQNAPENEFRSARLWRVGLTQGRENAPLGFDDSVEGAQSDFRLRADILIQRGPRQKTPREREIEALRALQNAEKALRDGKTAQFGSELTRARKLLEDAAKSQEAGG